MNRAAFPGRHASRDRIFSRLQALRLLMLALFFMAMPLFAQSSFEEALDKVVTGVLRGKTDQVEISALRTLARSNSVQLRTWGSRTIEMPFEDGWVFMVDDAPLANWAHPCRYVFVSADGSEIVVQQANTPLSVRHSSETRSLAEAEDEALEVVIPFDFQQAIETKKKVTRPQSRGAIRYDGNVSNCYAVIISGGANKPNNHIRYWGDVAQIYSTLTLKFGYPKTNIYALVSDGLDPAADRSDDTNSPFDLDGDGTNDTLAAATAVNISNVFVHLQSILTTNDQLLVFLTDHGGPTGGGGEWDVELNLWNEEVMRDKELKALTENLPCPVLFTMEQCYSGGFLDDLNQSNRLIATAAYYNESSYAGTTFPSFNQWAYYWTSAMRGFYPQTNAPWLDDEPCDADLNGDGFVSFAEASEFAFMNKYAMDNPMYQDNPVNMGRRTFLSIQPRDVFGMGGFALNALAPVLYTGRPVPLNITAQNVWDDTMTNYTGTLALWTEAAPIDPGFYVGTGTVASSYPLNSVWMDSRSQIIYPPDVMGGARTLDDLTLHVSDVPGMTLSNWTIRVKHTDLTAYPTNPVWETENWTTVQSTSLTITATGWVVFAFNQPFAYNGTQSLMLDFSFHNTNYTYSGQCRTTESTNFIAINYESDNEAGIPLDWAGEVPPPERSTRFPNLRFGPPLIPVTVAVTPTNLTGFVQGVCTGAVSFLNTGAVVRLWMADATNPAWKVSSGWLEVRDGSCSTLADATHAPQYTWTTGGDAEWFAQVEVVRDGGPCAAQAGAVGNIQSSWIQAEVTGNGLATFYWKVSSEGGFDYLNFYVNGEYITDLSGEVDWQQVQHELSGGVSTLRWEYAKDVSVSEGADTGWMTDFSFLPFTGRAVIATGDLAFGRVGVGTTAQRSVTLRCVGDEDVAVTDILLPVGFTADPVAFSLVPNQTTNVVVTFAPVEGLLYSGTFELLSDAQSGVSSLPISGVGLIVADRFVWTNSPGPAAPYTNWATAAHTIQEALDFAGDGDTVWVTNGVYDRGGLFYSGQTNRAVVGTGVVVRSINGPDVTHIVGAADLSSPNYGLGSASVRGVVLLNNAVLDGFTVRNGHANDFSYGGGVFAAQYDSGIPQDSPESTYITNCVISGNVSLIGGGVYGAMCYNSVIESNRAMSIGGGAVGAWLSDCVVRGNESLNSGGGLANSVAKGCHIMGNRAQRGGGVFSMAGLRNCQIIGNTATQYGGGAARCKEGGVLENCVVLRNHAPEGGGLYDSVAINSIIYHNTAGTSPNWDLRSILRFSCTTPLPEENNGTNNISEDPRIVSLTNPRLFPDSPCINAGTNQAWMATALDMDGEPRLNGIVDMGVDEFWANGLTDTLHVAISLPLGHEVAPGVALPFEADVAGRCAQTIWELDGISLTNLAFFSHVFTNIGDYEVRLTASNDAGVVSATVTVTVWNAVFYVTPDGDDANDGMSWAAAKQTIQSAVDACVAPGGVVWVSNGVYNTGGSALFGLSNRVTVTRPITVRSVNGAAFTGIHGAADPSSTNAFGLGSNAVRCVYLGGGATLEGFKLYGGRTAANTSGSIAYSLLGGGVLCETTNDVVSLCEISGNAALAGGGVMGGTIRHSIIESNEAIILAGGAFQSHLYNTRIVGNRAGSCGGLYISKAWNCLIAGNEAFESGGGTVDTELFNCTVVGNRAASDSGGVIGGTLINSIVYYNEARQYPNWHTSDQPEFIHSCTTPLPEGGANNFSAAPHLSGVYGAHLLASSPCIGAGLTQVWMSAATDCDDEPRLNGSSVDVGWDQFWPDACTNALVAAIGLPEGDRVAAGFALPLSADIVSGRALNMHLDFGDGSGVTNEMRVTHAWSAPGGYPVVLTATNHSFAVAVTNFIYVEHVIQHVAMSGNDAAAGTNWATAKQTIQAAVDDSIYGGLILVSNGVYNTGARAYTANATSNRVMLTKEVTLRSVNGPEVTVVAGQPATGGSTGPSAIRGVFMTANTRMEGFSLTNGFTKDYDYGGGIYAVDATAVISNCVVSGNRAFSGGGGVYRGSVYNSRLENNVSGPDFGGGGASYAHLFDCVVTSNSASYTRGGGIAYGTATRCQILGNVAAVGGGGTYYTAISNCVVRGNINSNGFGGGVFYGSAYNCLITENASPSMLGATYNVALYNCTVVNNSSGIRGGSALNSIIYGNTDYQWFDGGSAIQYTCTTPLPAGAGCFTNDPLLDAQGRLVAESPCVNAGANGTWMNSATDLDGNPRIRNTVVDMGAYESAWWGMHADVDGDGFTDWIEINVLGTDPTDAGSFLGMMEGGMTQDDGAGIVVRWQSVEGNLYNVDRATNLVANPVFQPWLSGVLGWPGYTTVTDTTATAEGPYFYRISVDP